MSAELTLEIDRTLPAAPARAFAAFSDPDVLATWFGPAGFSVGSVELDPRVEGAYRIEMRPPEGDPFYIGGEFREVDPPRRLVFTFSYEDPDPDDIETRVGLAFHDHGESTGVAFTQGPFRTEARRELHRDGWTDSFDRLAKVLSQQ